jgi:RAS guanyl-releasing protein 3
MLESIFTLRDGMISKAEMKTYFIRANYQALKREFKHDFHETTYFKPTFCANCGGLVNTILNLLINKI